MLMGEAIEGIRPGDEFFIEVVAKDVRTFGEGVFAVAFDLPIPAANLELTGEVQLLGDWDQIGEDTLTAIDEFHALENLIEHPGNASQPVVRFGVRAIAGGEVVLQLDPAERRGAELLLRGVDEVISPFEVDFGSLTLEIDGVRPTDTDGNGTVTPTDALRVINFLGVFGSVAVDELDALMPGDSEGENLIELAAMRRLDVNADGQISARDALGVINELARSFTGTTGEGESLSGGLLGEKVQDESELSDFAESSLF